MKLTIGIMALALAAVGCGGSTKSASTEESAAASKVIGPMMKENAGKGASQQMSANLRSVRVVQHYLNGKIGANDDTDLCANLDSSFGNTEDGVTCKKNSCSMSDTAINIDVTCSSTESFKFTCDSVDYTVKNITSGFKITATNNGNSASGSFTVSFGLNILGGALTGTGDLACGLSSDLKTEPTADDVTCKYDGKKIDPAVFKESYDSTSSTCTQSQITQN